MNVFVLQCEHNHTTVCINSYAHLEQKNYTVDGFKIDCGQKEKTLQSKIFLSTRSN